ncbi:MAG: Ig domain-containing protein, partial [Limisphaerales bacterium]
PGTYRLSFILPTGLDSVALSSVAVGTRDTVVNISFGPPPNRPPVLAPIGNKAVLAGQNFTFNVSASDPDGTTPTFSTSSLPIGASFADNGNGTGAFSWAPTMGQIGSHPVTFTASDGDLTDSELITITVVDPNAVLKGDLNLDGALCPSDAVLMLNCVFLGTGSCPLSVADLNCSEDLSPADAVLELNGVFLGAGLPC